MFRRLKPDASMAQLGNDGLGVRFLVFVNCKFDFDSFFGSQKFSQLATITINTCDVSSKMPCANMPELTHLSIVNTPVSQLFFETANSLAHLRIKKCDVSEEVRIDAEKFPKIRSLIVEGQASLRKSHFGELSRCKSLEALMVLDNPSVAAFFDNNENRITLQNVSVTDSGLTDNDCVSIGKCVNIETLNIRGNPITDTGVKNLSGLKNVRTIYLNRCLISEDVAVSLARLPKLEVLYVDQALVAPLKSRLPGVEVLE